MNKTYVVSDSKLWFSFEKSKLDPWMHALFTNDLQEARNLIMDLESPQDAHKRIRNGDYPFQLFFTNNKVQIIDTTTGRGEDYPIDDLKPLADEWLDIVIANTQKHVCPVCFYRWMDNEPIAQDGAATHEICTSCGTHFGYDDGLGYEKLQRYWIKKGMPWFSLLTKEPYTWKEIKKEYKKYLQQIKEDEGNLKRQERNAFPGKRADKGEHNKVKVSLKNRFVGEVSKLIFDARKPIYECLQRDLREKLQKLLNTEGSYGQRNSGYITLHIVHMSLQISRLVQHGANEEEAFELFFQRGRSRNYKKSTIEYLRCYAEKKKLALFQYQQNKDLEEEGKLIMFSGRPLDHIFELENEWNSSRDLFEELFFQTAISIGKWPGDRGGGSEDYDPICPYNKLGIMGIEASREL